MTLQLHDILPLVAVGGVFMAIVYGVFRQWKDHR